VKLPYMTKTAVLILMLIAFSGCTSLKTIEFDPKNNSLSYNIDIGDELVIQTKDLSSYTIMVDGIEPDRIEGRAKVYEEKDGVLEEAFEQNLVIDVSDISSVKTRKFSIWKTLGLAYGINSIIVAVLLYQTFTLDLELGD